MNDTNKPDTTRISTDKPDAKRSHAIALLIAGLTVAAALIVVVGRGGLIAWSALFFGAAALAKIWFKPAKIDLALSIGLATVAATAWAGTIYYVISTYESGEVVELLIDTPNGAHIARLWVLDMNGDEVVYYDAEPEVANALLTGAPLRFTRGDEVSIRTPITTRAEALPAAEASRVLETMATKYGDRMTAADVYYVLLGRYRDRIAVVVRLAEI